MEVGGGGEYADRGEGLDSGEQEALRPNDEAPEEEVETEDIDRRAKLQPGLII